MWRSEVESLVNQTWLLWHGAYPHVDPEGDRTAAVTVCACIPLDFTPRLFRGVYRCEKRTKRIDLAWQYGIHVKTAFV